MRERDNLQQHVLLIFLKDGSDVLEDLGAKEINAAVDDVTHKRARLFNIMQDLHKERNFLLC